MPEWVLEEVREELGPLMPGDLRTKEQLLTAAGGGFTTSEVARMLGMTVEGVYARRNRRQLLGVRLTERTWLYPRCQFIGDDVVPALPTVLAAFRIPEPWYQLAVLTRGKDSGTLMERIRLGEDASTLARVVQELESNAWQ